MPFVELIYEGRSVPRFLQHHFNHTNLSVMQTIKIAFLTFFAALLFVTACKKDDDSDGNAITAEELTNTNDYALSQALYTKAWETVVESAQKQSSLNGLATTGADDRGECPVVTVEPKESGVFPKTLTIDFGTGCTTNGGQTASGKIVAVFTGTITQSGTNITVTLNNFSYKGYTVGGTYNIKINPVGTYTGTITNGSVKTPDGKTATYAGSFTATQVEGQSTTGSGGTTDDVYTIAVNISGVDTNGKNYTAQTTTALRKELDCEWIVSGVVEIKITGQLKKTLDFGQGNCDNVATLKVGPVTSTVQLP